MGDGGIIVDTITLVQNLDMVADLHLQGALDDDITFLPFVGSQFDFGILRIFGIVGNDIKGFGNSDVCNKA